MDLAFYSNFSSALTTQEAQINRLQEEISTGLAVQTPDQDPTAYATATMGADEVSALSTQNSTQAAIQVQLGSVTTAYGAASTLLDSVQSLVEQALNGTTSSSDMAALATQVQAAQTQMQSLANSQSASGSYLFGGTRGATAPFQADPSSGQIIYLGDGGTSQAAITPDSEATTLANGEVFVSGLAGDGTASVTAASSNTGSASLISQGVVNAQAASAFQQGDSALTLSFADDASGALTYSATDASGTVVASGDVTGDDTSLQLGGVDYQLNGTPAAGDSFTLSPSRPQSVFTLLQNIVSALQAGSGDSAQAAQTRQVLDQSLSGIAQYQQDFLSAQAQVGVTLQAVSAAGTGNTTQSDAIQANDDTLTQVNMPAALTSLDNSMTAVEAAMKTFSDVQTLSLFQYL